MDSRLLDVALGMVLTFAVVAALSAAITELVARFLGLRARYLLLGLRELLDGEDLELAALAEAGTSYRLFREAAGSASTSGSTAGSGSTTATGSAGQGRSATEAVLGAPVMRTQGMAGDLEGRSLRIVKDPGTPMRLPRIRLDPGYGRIRSLWTWVVRSPLRGLPSYISPRSFSAAVIDLVVPDGTSGQTDMADLRRRLAGIEGFPTLTGQLTSLIKGTQDDIDQFRTAVEQWYDDHMDRVSGWYKRHVAKWSLGVGALLVVLLNVNAVTIAQTLYNDDAARTAVAAVAASAADCQERSDDAGQCLTDLQEQLAGAQDAGLPLGWSTAAACRAVDTDCNWWQARGVITPEGGWLDWQPVVVLLGLMVTIVALVPGGRFWFDLLGKMGSLRSSGPKPAPADG